MNWLSEKATCFGTSHLCVRVSKQSGLSCFLLYADASQLETAIFTAIYTSFSSLFTFPRKLSECLNKCFLLNREVIGNRRILVYFADPNHGNNRCRLNSFECCVCNVPRAICCWPCFVANNQKDSFVCVFVYVFVFLLRVPAALYGSSKFVELETTTF